jgi:uncharacterized protein
VNSKTESPFKVNFHELPRRAGEFRQYHLQFSAPQAIGIALLEIPKSEPIDISFKAESVDGGVLLTGTVISHAKGECGRCLDPIDFDVNQKFQELFLYSSKVSQVEDDEEVPIRDAVILSMPINPLCQSDCLGLCSVCGLKWRELEKDHAHKASDPRWSGLADWKP